MRTTRVNLLVTKRIESEDEASYEDRLDEFVEELEQLGCEVDIEDEEVLEDNSFE